MDKQSRTHQAYVQILKEELIPAIGVGHDDALDILDNVAAHADLDFVRHEGH